MEGVPRLPMVYVEMKENAVDLTGLEWAGMNEEMIEKQQQMIREGLEKHIREEYGDDPANFKSSIDEIISLQDAAYKVLLSPDFDGCNVLKKYFGQMHYMRTRFPFVGENAMEVSFSWNDAFTGSPTTQNSFEFEQAAILFNIGAIHSYLGAIDSRRSEEGIRMSCVHFQGAAGMFQYMLDHFDTTLSPDASSGMLKIYISLMMAQAQECLLEKSMQDNRKSIIVSKVAQQVVDNYKQTLRYIESSEADSSLGSSTTKCWKKLFSFKVVYYQAFTNYYLGNDTVDQERYGQSVGYFKVALDKFNESSKLAKNLQKREKEVVNNALKFASDVFNGKYTSAKKDNDFVYHEKIPDQSMLPEVKGAALVKALPFKPDDVNVTGPDIFAKLVPMTTHLAASTYSDEKDKLRRRVDEMIEEKDQALVAYKDSLNLHPDSLVRIEDSYTLDHALIESSAALSVNKSPIEKLNNAMESLTDMYDSVDVALNNVLDLTELEESDDRKIKDICGEESSVPFDAVDEIKKELSKYIEVHQETKQQKENLNTAIRIYVRNLEIVAKGLDAIRDEIKITPTNELLSGDEKDVVMKMSKLFGKITEMEEQRSLYQEKLKKNLEEDDVTSALVMKHGIDQQELFQEELKKHENLVDIIEKNLNAQGNILDAVTETNASYTLIRKKVDAERLRLQEKVKMLVDACTKYEDVIMKTEEGKEFFQKQLEEAESLTKKMEAVRLINTRERKQLIDRFREKSKKPPPRPSAPKPKSTTTKPSARAARPKVTPTASAHVLTPDEIAAMALEDDDDFNDPAFLAFLKASGEGDFDPSMMASMSQLHSRPTHGPPSQMRHTAPVSQYQQNRVVDPRSVHSGSPHMMPQHPAASMSPQHPPSSMHQPYRPQMQSPHPPMSRQPATSSLPPSPAHMAYNSRTSVSHQSFTSQPPSPMHRPVAGNVPPGVLSHHSQIPSPHTVDTVSGLISSSHRANYIPQQPPVSMQQGFHPTAYSSMPNQLHSNQPPQFTGHGRPLPMTGQGPQHGAVMRQSPSPQHSLTPHSVPQFNSNQPPPHGFVQQPFAAPNNLQYPPPASSPQPIQVSQVAVVYVPPTQQYSQAGQVHPATAGLHGSQTPVNSTLPIGSNHFPQFTGNMPPVTGQQPNQYPPSNTLVPNVGYNSFQQPNSVQPLYHNPPTSNQHPQAQHFPQQPHGQQIPPNRLPAAIQQSFPNQHSQGFQHYQPHDAAVQTQRFPQQPPSQVPQSKGGFVTQQPNQPQMQGSFNPQQFQPQNNANVPQQMQNNFPPQQTTNTSQQNVPHPNYGPQQVQNVPNQQQQTQCLQGPPPRSFAPMQADNAPQNIQPQSQFQQGTMPQNVNSMQPGNVQRAVQPQGNQQQFQQGMGQQKFEQRNQTPQQHQAAPQQHQAAPQQHQAAPQQHQPAPQQHGGAQHQHFSPMRSANISQQTQVVQQPGNQGIQPQQGVLNQQNFSPMQSNAVQQPQSNQQANRQQSPSHHQQQQSVRHMQPQQTNIPPQQANIARKHHAQPNPVAPKPPVPMDGILTPMNLAKPKEEDPMPSDDLAGLILTPTVGRSLSTDSADVLLSSNVESEAKNRNQTLLVPTKITEETESMLVRSIEGNAYMDEAELMKLKQEVEEMQKTVTSLLIKPPNGGLSEMDKHWKHLSDVQEKHSRQMTTAIARCTSYKNREQDIVPFDQSRVVLSEGKDDYINASLIDGLSPYCPRIIATQSPMPQTISDFWLMVHEQQVTIIVMLVKESEVPKKCPLYWPQDRTAPQNHGPITVSFTSSKTHRNGLYTERRFTIKHKKQSLATSVTQLQFNSWPDQRLFKMALEYWVFYINIINIMLLFNERDDAFIRGLLSSFGDLLSFMNIVEDFHSQQRSIQWPVVVHCHSGVGHTAVFTAIMSCVRQLKAGSGIPNIIEVVEKMRKKRKYMLQDKAQLKLVFDAVLYHAVDILKQRGVELPQEVKTPTPQRSMTPKTQEKGHFDIFSGKGELSSIQATVEKFTIKPESDKPPKKTEEEEPSKQQDEFHTEPNTTNNMVINNTVNIIQANVPFNISSTPEISDLVKGTMPVVTNDRKPTQTIVLSSIQPDIINSCNNSDINDDNAKHVSSAGQIPSNFSSQTSLSSKNDSETSQANLMDALSPDKFSIGQPEQDKKSKKITKADFFKPNSGLAAKSDPTDPFGGLDPLWGYKKKS